MKFFWPCLLVGLWGLPQTDLTALPTGVHVDAEVKLGDPVEVYLWDTSLPPTFSATLIDGAGRPVLTAQSFPLVLEAGLVLQACLLPIDSQAAPGTYSVRLVGQGQTRGPFSVQVRDRPFVSEDLPLDAANTTLRTKPDPQRDRESEEIWRLYNVWTGSSVFDHGVFSFPLAIEAPASAFFGDRRRYLYSNGRTDVSVHNGTDLAGPRGSAVLATAAGLVVMAKPRILTGNTVVLEHLPGVYSVYFHLDELTTTVGQSVLRGQTLGRLGSTGLSTAPHLHWEYRINGVPQEPQTLLSRGLLDKARIKAIITNTH